MTAESEDRELVDDLFHALSQPLTSLRCSMEVALLEQRTPGEYQEVLEQGLDLAERISGLVEDLRDLWDVQDSINSAGAVPAQACLDEIIGDLTPVAEAHGKMIIFPPATRMANIAGHLPRRGMALLLQHALAICAPFGEIKVEIARAGTGIQISVPQSVSGGASADKAEALRRRLHMAIARRSFASAGVSLTEQASESGWRCEVVLPKLSCERAKFSHFQTGFETGKVLPT